MPTIRINDWTKERFDEIKNEEDHSSFDSVVKSLIKDRNTSSWGEAK